jgi:hypothetical protein
MAIGDTIFTCHGLFVTPLWRTKRHVAGGVAIDVAYLDARTTAKGATVNAANLKRHSVGDALEWAAVDRENGFRRLTAGTYKGHARGLFPVWNGVAINARAKAAA